MEFRKKFQLALDDYIAFNFFHLKARLIAMPVMFVLLVPAAVTVIDLANYGRIDPVMLIVSLIISVILGGLIALANTISVRHAAKKQYQSSKAMQAENEIVVDEAGVRESGEFGNTVIGWPDVFKAAESASAYCIFLSRLQAFVIPKRLLAPPEEETLRALLLQHLPPEKVRLGQRG